MQLDMLAQACVVSGLYVHSFPYGQAIEWVASIPDEEDPPQLWYQQDSALPAYVASRLEAINISLPKSTNLMQIEAQCWNYERLLAAMNPVPGVPSPAVRIACAMYLLGEWGRPRAEEFIASCQ